MSLESIQRRLATKPTENAGIGFTPAPREHTSSTPVSDYDPSSNLTSKMIKGGERLLGTTSNLATRKAWLPLAFKFADEDPLALARLKELERSKDVLYPSDVIQEIPGFDVLKPKAVEGGMKVPTTFGPIDVKAGVEGLRETGKTLGRTVIDIAGDPLTYFGGVGSLTKAGKVSKVVQGTRELGETVGLTSKVAKQAAEVQGVAKPSAQVIKNVPKLEATTSGRIAKGQASLLNIAGVPIGKGKLASLPVKGFEEVSQRFADATIVSRIRKVSDKLFSTKTNDPLFDTLRNKYDSLVMHRAGLKIEEGVKLADARETLSRELGIPPDKLNKLIDDTVEQVIPVRTKGLSTTAKNAPSAELKKARRARLPLSTPAPTHYVPPVPPTPVDAKIQDIANDLTEKQQRQLMLEQVGGVDVQELLGDRQYAAHIMTPEARNMMRDAGVKSRALPKKASSREINDFLVNSIRREFTRVKPEVVDTWLQDGTITTKQARTLKGKDGIEYLDDLKNKGTISEVDHAQALHTLSINEVNETVSKGGSPLLGIKEVKLVGKTPKAVYNTVDEFFHTDPVYWHTVRGIRGERARTAAEFFDELKARGIAQEDKTAPFGWVGSTNPKLAGYKFEPSVAQHLDKMHEFRTNPEELRGFLKLFDDTQNAWKAWTLAIFPSYHSRNFVGNMWNNWLAGVRDPRWYMMANEIQEGHPVSFIDDIGRKWNTDKIRKVSSELQVSKGGQFVGDIEKTIAQELGQKKLFTLGQNNKIIDAGMRVGKSIEENARLAHFLQKLKNGETVAEAATSVKKYLFDYGDLTDFEKQYMKRLFPFYTWTRKNIPLQLQHLVTAPANYAGIFKLKHEVEANAPLETTGFREKYLADYFKDNFATRIRYNKYNKTYEYFMLNSWLPAADLAKLAQLHDVALNMLTPLPKEVIQQLWNYDFFLKKKIDTIPGARDKFLGLNLPTRVIHGAKLIRLLNEIDKMTQEDTSLFAKVVGLVTGKAYTVDPVKSHNMYIVKVKNEIKELQSQMRKMAAKGNDAEVARIQGLIQEKAKEF